MPIRHVIGVDIGGTKLLGGVVDEDLRVHHRVGRPTVGKDTVALLDTVQEAVEDLIHAAEASQGVEVESVGFGIPSMIDRRTETSVQAIHLPLQNVPFAALMGERLRLPVHVDNDGNAAVLAEHRAGAAVGADDVVMLTVGTGIGGGLILGGELYRGSVGAAAELGHMVIDLNGPPCQGNCPNHGCLEVMASGTALNNAARAAAAEQPDSALGRALAKDAAPDGALVTELAHDGDQVAAGVIELIGTRLGIGVANYVNIFNPDVVVIGGGVIGAGEMLMTPIRREVAARALPPARDVVNVLPAHFGAEAGMIGAAALALSPPPVRISERWADRRGARP